MDRVYWSRWSDLINALMCKLEQWEHTILEYEHSCVADQACSCLEQKIFENWRSVECAIMHTWVLWLQFMMIAKTQHALRIFFPLFNKRIVLASKDFQSEIEDLVADACWAKGIRACFDFNDDFVWFAYSEDLCNVILQQMKSARIEIFSHLQKKCRESIQFPGIKQYLKFYCFAFFFFTAEFEQLVFNVKVSKCLPVHRFWSIIMSFQLVYLFVER